MKLNRCITLLPYSVTREVDHAAFNDVFQAKIKLTSDFIDYVELKAAAPFKYNPRNWQIITHSHLAANSRRDHSISDDQDVSKHMIEVGRAFHIIY